MTVLEYSIVIHVYSYPSFLLHSTPEHGRQLLFLFLHSDCPSNEQTAAHGEKTVAFGHLKGCKLSYSSLDAHKMIVGKGYVSM